MKPGEWKIVEGPSTLIDTIGTFGREEGEEPEPWVYHFAPHRDGGQLIADHPWDNSYEAAICTICAELCE